MTHAHQMPRTKPLCPTGQPCFLNVCGVYSPKSPPSHGCWRRRMASLKAAQANGGEAVFNQWTGLFERRITP